jgi:hypothetical protein
MIDTRVVGQEIQDKILEQVRKGQEQVRKSQETMAETFKNWTATAQSITPQLPMPTWTARLPKPEELMANAQDLAAQWLAAQLRTSEQLLAAQKKFAEDAFDAVKPLLALATAAPITGSKAAHAAVPKTAKPAGTKPASKPASKPATVKSTAAKK